MTVCALLACVFLPTACLPDTGVYNMLDWALPFSWFLMQSCVLAQRVTTGLTSLPLMLLVVWRQVRHTQRLPLKKFLCYIAATRALLVVGQ